MLLYHFTALEYLEAIQREGLTKGEAPLSRTEALNAVNLTTSKHTDGHGLGEARDLTAVIDSVPMLSPSHVATAEWMSEHYLAPLFDCVSLMLPSGFKRRPVTILSPLATARRLGYLYQQHHKKGFRSASVLQVEELPGLWDRCCRRSVRPSIFKPPLYRELKGAKQGSSHRWIKVLERWKRSS